MKLSFLKLYLLALLFSMSFQVTSCKSKPKDSDIQASVNEKLSANPDYANITATVNNGVVTLSGQSSSEAGKESAEQAVKEVKGVTQVVDNVTVAAPAAPVEVASDETLRTSVRDAIKDYPGVNAEVNNGEVTLTGSLKRDRLPKLMMALNELKPKKINNKLTVK